MKGLNFSLSNFSLHKRGSFQFFFSKPFNAGEILPVENKEPFINPKYCLFVCLLVGCLVDVLPLQVCPSPVYPALQLQEYEPTVFTQSAFTSQL